MKQKLLTLLTLLLGVCSGAWAADYTVTATRTLSNSNKTSTWSAITANGGSYFENSKTALGSGLYFVAKGKCTLDGGNSLNVKANGEMYLEVPSATAAGTVKFTNGNNARYMQTASGGKVHMKGDSDNGELKASLAFTSADIVDVDGVNYLKLTSQSDCKFATVEIVLTSGVYLTMLTAPTINVAAATGTVTIPAVANASSIKYTIDGTEPSNTNGTTYSDPFVVEEGAIVKAIAIGDGVNYANSAVTTKQVLKTGIKMVAPTFKQYNGTVLISTTSPAAKIYYTTDGSTPTSLSTLYTYPFTLSSNATVKAVAVREGCTDSDVESIEVTAISNTKTKTIYMGWGSFDTSNAKALASKAGDEAEGFSMTCTKDLATGTQKHTTIDKTYIKLPNGSQVTLNLPTGVMATKITFYSFINSATSSSVCGWKEVNGVDYQTGEGDYKNIPMGAFSDIEGFKDAPDVRSYALDNVTGSVTFTNGGVQICTLIALDVIETVAVSTLAERNYASYVTSQKLDFASAEGITAYIATGLNGGNDAVVLQSVDVVPAGTPIIVKTDTKGATVNVPITTAEASDVSANKLVAGDGTTVANSDYYYLASDQFHLATSGTLQSGKAYLQIPATARDLSIVIDEATALTLVNSEKRIVNSEVFDLQGRRVAQPTKGLYIKDGKKVVIK